MSVSLAQTAVHHMGSLHEVMLLCLKIDDRATVSISVSSCEQSACTVSGPVTKSLAATQAVYRVHACSKLRDTEMANILACNAIGPDCRKCETRNERCRIPCLAAQLVPTAQTDLPPSSAPNFVFLLCLTTSLLIFQHHGRDDANHKLHKQTRRAGS